ncbi:MAG: hypothetical protein HEP71_01375 [Roseivirga sp.]|nr:hypothetical protein [Roseivirga sp.]
MDSNIEKLLDKYWAAEASLEEEKELRTLLTDTEAGEEQEELQGLFAHFDAEKEPSLGADFDDELMAMIETEPEVKVISFSDYFKRYASMAAAVLVLFISSYVFIINQNSYVQEDTFESPEAALQEIKKQLLTVSMYMNKGNNQISELSNLGKADMGMEDLSKINEAARSLEPLNRMNIRR